jgi:outer membrane translocation and assembly module TamA
VLGWELFGLGLAGFLDYGGAWHDFQEPRAGGNIGAGLRLGFTAGQGADTVRIDFAYLWGDGIWGDGIPDRSGGNRFAISIGSSFFY